MISYLKVKNFALIDELTVEFEEGLNVITGETGAGKSMIIEAINTILGAPVNQNWIKDNADFLEVEALFFLDSLTKKQLSELEKIGDILLDDYQLIVRRQFHPTKKNKCFINDHLVTLSLLQTMGNYLIDLHGQHSHQLLLNPEYHIDFVDNFGNRSFLEKKDELKNYFNKWQSKTKLLNQLLQKHSELLSKKDYLLFQLQEIEQAQLKEGEDEEIKELMNIIQHKAKIKEIMEMANAALFEGGEEGSSLYDILTKLISHFSNISMLEKNIEHIKEQLTDIKFKIEDVATQIIEYKDKIDFDAYQLQELEDRLNLINHLKHKYGSQIKDILIYHDTLQREINSLEDNQLKIEQLGKEIREDEKRIGQLSLELSSQRRLISDKLEKDIIKELAELSMKDCNFIIQIKKQEDENGIKMGDSSLKVTKKGIDRIEFLISTNIGEKEKPLANIVSGGEVSRIMLGLKSILSKADQIPTMIFDEIDSGVGARLGEVIAQKLAKIARDHQVIAVTHLPQIACQANQHIFIDKYVSQNKTSITLKKLVGEEQLYEIARMLDGEKYGSISIEHARKMLSKKG